MTPRPRGRRQGKQALAAGAGDVGEGPGDLLGQLPLSGDGSSALVPMWRSSVDGWLQTPALISS
jgi:hypothetical protein